MNPGVLVYVPPATIPPKICCPGAFLANITRFKTKYPLVYYSDANWPNIEHKISNPEAAINPNARLKNGQPNRFAVNNVIFFLGLRLALRKGFTHICYLEADCRVGCDYWDEALFDFHFRHPEPLVCSGTAVAFNVCTAGRAAMLRWYQWLADQKCVDGFIPATYGWSGQQTTTEQPTVFVNGALGVYDTRWLAKLFNLSAEAANALPGNNSHDLISLAESTFAWDFAIGYELWKHFGIHVFDLVANNPRMYSGYGDVLSTEAERMQMLKDGAVTCVHQIKSGANL